MTLLDMASGVAAVRIRPTAKAGGRWKSLPSAHAPKGMIVYWATVPMTTRPGRLRICLKSPGCRAAPIPNMVTAKNSRLAVRNAKSLHHGALAPGLGQELGEMKGIDGLE